MPATARPPILVMADLHGHPAWFDEALARGRRIADRDDVSVVTLGDYCDNGPDVPGLLDRLSGFGDEHPGAFLPVLGNHDLACLLTLGWPGRDDADFWWDRWGTRYPNGNVGASGVAPDTNAPGGGSCPTDRSGSRRTRGRAREDACFPATPPRAEMPADYPNTLADIKRRIQDARLRIVVTANTAMVGLYWDIGRMILDRQSAAGWGARK